MAFRDELDSPPPANPPEITGFLQGVTGAKSSSAEAAVAGLGPGSGLDSRPDSL